VQLADSRVFPLAVAIAEVLLLVGCGRNGITKKLTIYSPHGKEMLSEFEKRNFPAIAVLPYASANHADPKAAATAIKSIAKAYRLKVDVKDLEFDAKDIEEELDKRLEETARSLRGMYV
jgi:predicted ATP-grasp superfamily ATP-dependent carboligase